MRISCFIISLLWSVALLAQNDSIREKIFDPLIIDAKQKKEVVYADERYYIIDFDISKNGKCLLVNRFNEYFLYPLNNDFQVYSKCRLHFKPQRLYWDCMGFVHVFSRDSMYQVSYDHLGNISLSHANSIKVYYSLLRNCVASNSRGLIFRQFIKGGIHYYLIPNFGESSFEIYSVVDSIR